MTILTEAPIEALDLNYARLPRSSRNQYDNSTIVSIFPVAIEETKPTIQPGIFRVPAGSIDKPAVVTIGSSSWWSLSTGPQPPIEVICSSVEVAHAVIFDYCNGLPECNMEDKTPGLFFVPGRTLDVSEVKRLYATKLKEVEVKQKAWYAALVDRADSDWSKSNGNPLTIWELMRVAARDLGHLDKPWLTNSIAMTKVKCKFCGNLKDPEYPVCMHCRIPDPDHPTMKNIKVVS